LRKVLQEIAGAYCSDQHDHFATGLARFHHPMRFLNVFKAKHSRRFCFVATSGDLMSDVIFPRKSGRG
jgi:hypothetical protein